MSEALTLFVLLGYFLFEFVCANWPPLLIVAVIFLIVVCYARRDAKEAKRG